MLGKTEPYQIPEVRKYSITEAKENIYRNTPPSSYGIREHFKIEYHRMN